MYMRNEFIKTKVLLLVMTSCRLTDGGGMVVVYWCEMMRCTGNRGTVTDNDGYGILSNNFEFS